MNRKVLGIDIGGTNLRGALLSDDGKVIKRSKIPSGAGKGITYLVDTLAKFIKNFDAQKPACIGIGIPGIMNRKSGILTQAPNIEGVDNYPLVEMLNERLDGRTPFVIENDANCAAVGEYWMGAGKSATSSLVMLTIGTGLGGGIILGGTLWSGEDGMAGEIGHMTINSNGPLCNCGNNGCIETYVSAEALRRMVGENPEIKNKLGQTDVAEYPEALMLLAENGDKTAESMWKELGKNLGTGIASLANILNMEMVVIGGGLSNAWNYFIEDTVNEVKKRGLRAPCESLKIERTALGDDAGIFGAGYLAIKSLEEG